MIFTKELRLSVLQIDYLGVRWFASLWTFNCSLATLEYSKNLLVYFWAANCRLAYVYELLLNQVVHSSFLHPIIEVAVPDSQTYLLWPRDSRAFTWFASQCHLSITTCYRNTLWLLSLSHWDWSASSPHSTMISYPWETCMERSQTCAQSLFDRRRISRSIVVIAPLSRPHYA